MTPDRCSTPYCRGEVHVIHLGKGLCEKCWSKMCDEDHKAHIVKGG